MGHNSSGIMNPMPANGMSGSMTATSRNQVSVARCPQLEQALDLQV
jgi:hypothetical protein